MKTFQKILMGESINLVKLLNKPTPEFIREKVVFIFIFLSVNLFFIQVRKFPPNISFNNVRRGPFSAHKYSEDERQWEEANAYHCLLRALRLADPTASRAHFSFLLTNFPLSFFYSLSRFFN